jgi:hypothetical protein
VPPCHGELEPVLHGFAANDALGLIIMESKGILGLFALERDLPDLGEVFFNCHN